MKMASSQVDISSAAFGCVLRDHSCHDGRRKSNVRAVQAAFEKNLRVLMRDQLNSCTDQNSSSGNRVVATQNGQPNLKCKTKGTPEPSPRSMKPSHPSGAASSLVQIWEARLGHTNSPKKTPTSSRTTSGPAGNNTCSDSSNEETQREPEIDRGSENSDNNNGDIQKEEPNWESRSDRTVQSESLSTADSVESERVKVADITRRLSCDQELQPNNIIHSGGAMEFPVRERRLNALASDQTLEQRCSTQVLSSPRIRGRQAIADLLTQLERDRQKELNSLAGRRVVSKFTQKGRLQAMLRIRCLERCMAIQDRQRSKSVAPDSNRLSPPSAVTQLGEKLKMGGESGEAGQLADSPNSKSPRFEISKSKIASESSSLASGWKGDGGGRKDSSGGRSKKCRADHSAGESSDTQTNCLPLQETVKKAGLTKSSEGAKNAPQGTAEAAHESSTRSTLHKSRENDRRRREKESSSDGLRGKHISEHVSETAGSEEAEVKEAFDRLCKKGQKQKNKEETAEHCVPEKDIPTGGSQQAATKTLFHKPNQTIREEKFLRHRILDKTTSLDTLETNDPEKISSRTPLHESSEGDKGIRDAETPELCIPDKAVANCASEKDARTRKSGESTSKADFRNSGEVEKEKNQQNWCVQSGGKSESTTSLPDLCGSRRAEEEQKVSYQWGQCLGLQESNSVAEVTNDWDSNEAMKEEEEETDDQYYYVESNYDWFSDICRPRSYWEDLRKAWYMEALNTDSEKYEIRQLLERRPVSNFLASDMRERIDSLMMSRLQDTSRIQTQKRGDYNEQWLRSCLPQDSFLSSQDQEGDEGSQIKPEQEPEKDQGHEMDEKEQQLYEAASDRMSQSSSQTSAPSFMRSWSCRDNEASDDTDRITSASPPVSLPSHSQSYNRNNDDKQSSFLLSQPSAEIDLICDLKAQMEQLQREMFELKNYIKSSVDMLMQLPKSFNQEAFSGESTRQLKRKCCVCYEMPVDSLLYRCGHTCACLKCAHELQCGSGKCPICEAPIADVVQVFLDP